MAGTAVLQSARVDVEKPDKHGCAVGTRNQRGHRVQLVEHPRRLSAREQQCARRAAELSHHGGRRQSAADAITDNDADPSVAHLEHVVPVTPDLERRHRGFVADGEADRRLHGGQHRALQRQRCLARDFELLNMLHGQAQMPDKGSDQ